MEVKETAACGIIDREFAIELDETEIAKLYKALRSALESTKDFDANFVEDLIAQMEHIVGQSLHESS